MIARNPQMRFEGQGFQPSSVNGGFRVGASLPNPGKRHKVKGKGKTRHKATRLGHAPSRRRARRNDGTPAGQDVASIITASTPVVGTIVYGITGKKKPATATSAPSVPLPEEKPSALPWILGGLGVVVVIGGGIWAMNRPTGG